MPTQCVSEQFRFEGFDGRRVEAAFDGGAVTSDAGALLLREADRAIGLTDRVAACFRDGRAAGRVVHVLYPFRSNLTGCDGGGVVSERRHRVSKRGDDTMTRDE